MERELAKRENEMGSPVDETVWARDEMSFRENIKTLCYVPHCMADGDHFADALLSHCLALKYVDQAHSSRREGSRQQIFGRYDLVVGNGTTMSDEPMLQEIAPRPVELRRELGSDGSCWAYSCGLLAYVVHWQREGMIV